NYNQAFNIHRSKYFGKPGKRLAIFNPYKENGQMKKDKIQTGTVIYLSIYVVLNFLVIIAAFTGFLYRSTSATICKSSKGKQHFRAIQCGHQSKCQRTKFKTQKIVISFTCEF